MSEDIKNSAAEVAKNKTEISVNKGAVESKADKSEDSHADAEDNRYPEIKKMRTELKSRRLENEKLSAELLSLKSDVEKTKNSLNSISSIKEAMINAEVKSLINEYDVVDKDIVRKVLDFSKVDVNGEGVQGLRQQLDDLLINKQFLFKPKKSSGIIDYSVNKAGEKVDAMKLKRGEDRKHWHILDKQ